MYELKLIDDKSMSEIYQSVSIEFAFAKIEEEEKKTVRQLHPFIKCRDFLGDALYATIHNAPFGVYGFSFDGTKEKVDRSKMTLLIRYSNKEAITNHLPTMNELEKAVKWKRTKLTDLKHSTSKGHYFLAVSSGCWMRSTSLISLYTLLWRLAAKKRKDKETLKDFLTRCSSVGDNDGRYLNSVFANAKKLGSKDPLLTIMRRSKKIFTDCCKKYPSDEKYGIHDNNGIVSLFKKAGSSNKSTPTKFADHNAILLRKELQ